ncbi:hypothetical protein ACHWQZ_G007739 [Mnemiopsis leidyi]
MIHVNLIWWFIWQTTVATTASTHTGAFKSLDFPDPPSINNYVHYDVADFGEISEFSVALWIREHEHQVSNMRYIFSYSSDGGNNGNDILIGRDIDNNQSSICILGHCLNRAVNIERSTWYHIVLCWDIKSGFTLFKDGSLVDSGDLKLSAVIKSGGVLILGQDQDILGGGFHGQQSFSGSLNELNWFKKKITSEQVKDIFDNGIGISVPISLGEHLILDWSDVIKLPLTGAVTLQNEILRDGCRMIEHYNGRCIEPEVSPAQVGTKLTMQSTCEGENFLFCYGNDERIYHAQTNLCLVKEGLSLQLGSNCDEDATRWEFTSGKSIRQISSGLCWHPEGGYVNSGDGTRIHVTTTCDQNRLQFTWVTGHSKMFHRAMIHVSLIWWLTWLKITASTTASTHTGCRMMKHYNGRCIGPEVSPAQVGTKLTMQSTCEGEYFLFCYGNDERIYHAQTNLCLVTEGIYLQLGSNCDEDASRWEFTSGKSIRQISSGLCWHPEGGRQDSGDGTRLIVTNGCNENRLQFTWVTDCYTLPMDWINVQADLPATDGTVLTLTCPDKYFQIGDKFVTCVQTFSVQKTPKCLRKSKLKHFSCITEYLLSK